MYDLWERQASESPKAFSAFLTYREMPPAERSLAAAYRLATGDPTKRKLSGQWRRWAAKHQWQERALAFDRHRDALRQTAAEKTLVEVEVQRVRQIEISAQAVLQETAALALSSITDIVEWDETGRVTIKASDQIPAHAAAAVAKLNVGHDKAGNPNVVVEMHPKIRPLDLLGQHYNLWDSEKKQAEKTATNAFLEFLHLIKNGALDELESSGMEPPSLRNPPPGIVIEYEVTS